MKTKPNFGNTLALEPSSVSELLESLSVADVETMQAAVDRKAADSRGTNAVDRGGVRVIPVHGILSQKNNLFASWFGWTTYDGLAADIDDAVADDSVTAIVLDVDSPGGTVSGLPEIAGRIFKARGTKPIHAIANPMAASAAYYIASAADELHVLASGEVGSIGVILIHQEITAALENEGVKTTIVRSGKYKYEGSEFEPLSKEALANFQSVADVHYGMFVNAVAKHRGVAVADVRGGYGQGRMLPAKAAIAEGMADRVSTLEDTVKRAGSGRARAAASRAGKSRLAFLKKQVASSLSM